MRIPRIYADTSVIGGCLDIEFSHESLHFIEMVRNGKCVLLLSEITIAELDKAPTAVQNILLSLPEEAVEKVEITEEILELRNEYMKAKILQFTILKPTQKGIGTISTKNVLEREQKENLKLVVIT